MDADQPGPGGQGRTQGAGVIPGEIPAEMLQRILDVDRTLTLDEKIEAVRSIAAEYDVEISIRPAEDRLEPVRGDRIVVVGLDPRAVPEALMRGIARKTRVEAEVDCDFRERMPRDLAERRETRGMNRGSIRERNRAEMRRAGLQGRGRR